MQFGYEQLDVYRVSVRYVAWAYEVAKSLKGIDRHARDQLLRASQSIPLNIAEGNGKGTNADRRRKITMKTSILAATILASALTVPIAQTQETSAPAGATMGAPWAIRA